MSNKNLTLLTIGLTLFILLLVIFLNKKDKESQDALKGDYKVTVGYFLSYYELADSGTPVVEYYYYVNNRKYNGSVYTSTKYKYCNNNIQCKEKRFWVIYSSKKPNKSLIDLTQEIQGMDKPLFPETLDNFK